MIQNKLCGLSLSLIFALFLGCGTEDSYQYETDHHISTNEPVVLKLYDGYNRGRPEKREEVRKFQEMLKELGYEITIDGFYGHGTAVAVRLFQHKYGLIVAGNTVFKSTYELVVKSVEELRQISPPTAELDILEFTTKTTERRKGMRKGYPVYWIPYSHEKEFKMTVFKSEAKARLYSDLWTIKELNKTLPKLQKLGVVGINHQGSYSYRYKGNGELSRHAFALGLDMRGFYMKDGSFLSVLKHWNHPTKGKILRNIHNAFCESWDVVLGPNYNAKHRDHFHVDLDPKLRKRYEDPQPVWKELPRSLRTSWSLSNSFDEIAEDELQEEYEAHAHEPIDYEEIERLRALENNGKWNANGRAFCR